MLSQNNDIKSKASKSMHANFVISINLTKSTKSVANLLG